MPPRKKRTISSNKQQQAGTKRKREIQTPHVAKSPRKPRAVEQNSRACDICAETKLVYRNFPEISTCKHEPNVCLSCYERHTVVRIQSNPDQGWDACTCPGCNVEISQGDIQGILPRTIAKEIDKLVKQSRLRGADNWLWCPSPGCGHGQLHNPSKLTKVKCSRCAAKICLHHQRLWHDGMTCFQYDIENSAIDGSQKNLMVIKRTTKACPHCARRIEKGGGCNHMYCTGCKKYFFWDAIPFDGETTATSAEVAGGVDLGNSLPPEQRELVEEVMRFENGQRENPDEIQQDVQVIQPPIHAVNRPPPPMPIPGWIRNIAQVHQVAMTAFTNFMPLIIPGQAVTQRDATPVNPPVGTGNTHQEMRAPPAIIDLTEAAEAEGQRTIIDLTGGDD